MLRKFDRHFPYKKITINSDSTFINRFDSIAKKIIYDIQTKIEQQKGIKIDNFHNWVTSVKSLSIALVNAFQCNSLTYQHYEKFTDSEKFDFHASIVKCLIQKYSLDNMLITMPHRNNQANYFLLYVFDSPGNRSNQSSVQGRMILSGDIKNALYSFLIYKNASKQLFTFFKGCNDKQSILNQALPKELQSLIANKLLASCIEEQNDKIQPIKPR